MKVGIACSQTWMLLGTLIAMLAPQAVLGQTASPEDTTAAVVPVLNLRQCLEIALRSSTSLAVSEQRRHKASQDLTAAYGGFLPDLSVSRTDVRDQRTDYGVEQTQPGLVPFVDTGGDTLFFATQLPTGVIEDQESKTRYSEWQVQSNLNVFDGFRKYGDLKTARNSLWSAEANEAYQRELVVQNVASAYYDLLRYERLLEVAGETRDLAERELEKSETYFRLGSAAKSDVLQARVRLENTRLDVVRAQNAVAQAFANLAYAMNQPLAAPFEIDRSPLATDFQTTSLDTLYAEALANRLDLKGQQYALEATKGVVRAATSGLWPRLDLFLQYSRSNNENAQYRFGAQKSGLFRYGYQVQWSVFDRLSTLTGRSKAKADERIAAYNLEQARLDAQLEIRQLYNNLVEARERVSLSRETIVQAQEELRLAQERFRVGAGTTLDRINAEVNLAQARADEVQAVCDFLINSVQLDRATGRTNRYGGSEP